MQHLHAARAQWAGDSLGRMLVYNRLGDDDFWLQRFDSAYHYLRRAWRLAGPAQRRQQPAEVVEMANSLTNHYHTQGCYLFTGCRLKDGPTGPIDKNEVWERNKFER